MSQIEKMFSLFATSRKDGKEVRIWEGKGGTYIKQGGKNRIGTTLFFEPKKSNNKI